MGVNVKLRVGGTFRTEAPQSCSASSHLEDLAVGLGAAALAPSGRGGAGPQGERPLPVGWWEYLSGPELPTAEDMLVSPTVSLQMCWVEGWGGEWNGKGWEVGEGGCGTLFAFLWLFSRE